MRANERTDERVAQYFCLHSWFFWPTVARSLDMAWPMGHSGRTRANELSELGFCPASLSPLAPPTNDQSTVTPRCSAFPGTGQNGTLHRGVFCNGCYKNNYGKISEDQHIYPTPHLGPHVFREDLTLFSASNRYFWQFSAGWMCS